MKASELRQKDEAGLKDEIMALYLKLEAYPEAAAALEAVKARGKLTAILSNGSPTMLQQAVLSAGLAPHLDRVLSVDGVRQFKTTPWSYDLVQQHYPVAKDEVLFVSSNGWDALGATWYGFTTFWVNRQGLPFETLGPRPSHSGPDLRHILSWLPSA